MLSSNSDTWVKLFDPGTGQAYYANKLTNATQWQKPEGTMNRILRTCLMMICTGFTDVAESTCDGDNTCSTSHSDDVCIVGTIFLHRSDPFSLKLLIWLSEVHILHRMVVICSSESNEEEVKTRYKTMIAESQSKVHHIPDTLTYPTALFHDRRVVSGADMIINCMVSEGYYEQASLTDTPDRDTLQDVQWDGLTLFNFYSCGLLPEIGNMIVQHQADDNFSAEYLRMHQEHIRLQLYMDASSIHDFRQQQSLRQEVLQLKEENRRLSREMDKRKSMYSMQRVNALEEVNASLVEENDRLSKDVLALQEVQRKSVTDMRAAKSELESLLESWWSVNNRAMELITPGCSECDTCDDSDGVNSDDADTSPATAPRDDGIGIGTSEGVPLSKNESMGRGSEDMLPAASRYKSKGPNLRNADVYSQSDQLLQSIRCVSAPAHPVLDIADFCLSVM